MGMNLFGSLVGFGIAVLIGVAGVAMYTAVVVGTLRLLGVGI